MDVTERFRVVPAAYVLLLRGRGSADGEVLLQYRQGTGYMDDHWASGAAGHIERGESAIAAAVREASEELGIVVTPDALELATVMHRTGASGAPIDERVDFFFTCRQWQGEPAVQEHDLSGGLRWVRLDHLPSLGAPIVPHELHVLERLRSGDLPALTFFGFDSL